MSDTGMPGCSMRRRFSLAITLLIVLDLTLSGVLGNPSLVAGFGGARVVPGEVSSVAAARTREGKRTERSKERNDKEKEQKRRDEKQKRSDKHGRKEKESTPSQPRRDGTARDGKKARHEARPQDEHQARELSSGRLSTAPTIATAAERPPSAKGRYIVILDEMTTNALGVATTIANDAPGMVPTHVYSNVFQGFAAIIPDEALAAVRRNPRVKAVVPDEVVRGAAQTVPMNIKRVAVDTNSTANIDGRDERVDIDVAVIDSAGYSEHSDVNVWAWANCTDSPNNSDDQGHGTHVGGTIGALDNGIGVVGVAPGARLWNIRVLEADPSGGTVGLQSWIICGLDLVRQYAIPQPDGLGDIEVANLSLGRAGTDSNCQTQVDVYHWAFCKLVAAGVTVVVAAMNDAQDAANVVPATYAEVITVSALADSDGKPGGLGGATSAGRDDSLATFSNFGADIDIAAPGVDILSTVPTGSCELCDPSGYQWLNGTSMAAPHVAGAAALYLAIHPGASPAEVKTELVSSRERIALPGDPDGIDEGVLLLGQRPAPPPPPAPPLPPPPDAPSPPVTDAPPPTVSGGTQDPDKKVKKKHKKGKKGKKGKGKGKH